VDRVLANVQAQLKDHPKDASAWLVLGRLHSYAFFSGSQQVPMRGDHLFVRNIPAAPRTTPPSPEDLAHLKQSMEAFRKSIALDPTNALPYLGLGWDMEQGVRYGAGSEEAALEDYRLAYDRAAKREAEMKYFAPGYEAVSQEAAQRIVAIQQRRLKESKKDMSDARAEIDRLQQSIAKLGSVPRAVTPVIFSFRESTSLGDLLDARIHVAFDLDGFGGSAWSWVKPSTGILVWDPGHTGAIQSGLQLFGSVTWWMFWRDGYQALAALDDNHDGWLSGRELDGVAVWVDRNQNGRSDPGEVITAGEAGIVRISVAGTADAGGTLGNAQGIEFGDGRRTPSYDWIAEGEGSFQQSAVSDQPGSWPKLAAPRLGSQASPASGGAGLNKG
jgi:hypothetical protein